MKIAWGTRDGGVPQRTWPIAESMPNVYDCEDWKMEVFEPKARGPESFASMTLM